MICGTYILQQLYGAMIGAGIYYMTWVLKNKNLFGQFAWSVNIPLIIALIFTPTLVGKWKGMYKLNSVSYTHLDVYKRQLERWFLYWYTQIYCGNS